MSETKKLVIVMTAGLDDERASVAWSIANGAINNGLELMVFLTSNAVDWVRKGAAEFAHLNPIDPPMKDMIQAVVESGSEICVCPPCAKVRGYTIEDFIDGIRLVGSVAIHEKIKEGAQTLSF